MPGLPIPFVHRVYRTAPSPPSSPVGAADPRLLFDWREWALRDDDEALMLLLADER